MKHLCIDLHIHTLWSDGSRSVSDVLATAQSCGLDFISITDHNTIGSYNELCNSYVRSIFKGKIIPGIEITTAYDGEMVEILGYGIDTHIMHDLLEKYTLPPDQMKKHEIDAVLKTFKKIGFQFSEEYERGIRSHHPIEFIKKTYGVKNIKKSAYFDLVGNHNNFEVFGREMTTDPHCWVWFLRNEINNPRSKFYVDTSRFLPSLQTAVDMVHRSGGLAFLAHTYVYSENIANSLDRMVSQYAIDGLECHYATFTEEQTVYLTNFCNSHGLYCSGGSDYHGPEVKAHNFIGAGTSGQKIAFDLIKPWINQIDRIQ